jgi:LmbE family N-acetylglucosaminyl deacetylase
MVDVLVICAHNDDQVIGAGGTLLKYALEGKSFKTLVFSYGEKTHPYLKSEVISKIRFKEGVKSDRILGGSGITCFGLKDFSLKRELKRKDIKKKFSDFLKKENPKKIFTHSLKDSHPDHKAVFNLVKNSIEKKEIVCDVYSFDVWSLFSSGRNSAKLVVDVTSTFEQKLEALLIQKSQKKVIFPLIWSICLKALINGWFYKCKYAEVFNRIN